MGGRTSLVCHRDFRGHADRFFLGCAAPVQYTGAVGLVSQQSMVRCGGDCRGGGCGSGGHVWLLHADGFLRSLRALVVCDVHQRRDSQNCIPR